MRVTVFVSVVTGDEHRINTGRHNFTRGLFRDRDALRRRRPAKPGGVLRLLRCQRAGCNRQRRGEAQRAGGDGTNAHN